MVKPVTGLSGRYRAHLPLSSSVAAPGVALEAPGLRGATLHRGALWGKGKATTARVAVQKSATVWRVRIVEF